VDPFDIEASIEGDYSDGGQSIADMNADRALASIDWTGQEIWRWT